MIAARFFNLMLLQEETGVPGENLWCLVESATFSHVTEVKL